MSGRSAVPITEVIARLQRLLDNGVIRRIGAVPNHYAIGHTANGMSVWDIDDAVIDAIGERVGGLAGVTHCYCRLRLPMNKPVGKYNVWNKISRSEGTSH